MAALARDNGWVLKSQHGSHMHFRDPISGRIATIPVHGGKTLRSGTQKAIMKTLGLTEDDL